VKRRDFLGDYQTGSSSSGICELDSNSSWCGAVAGCSVSLVPIKHTDTTHIEGGLKSSRPNNEKPNL